jgi:hypothetical protein
VLRQWTPARPIAAASDWFIDRRLLPGRDRDHAQRKAFAPVSASIIGQKLQRRRASAGRFVSLALHRNNCCNTTTLFKIEVRMSIIERLLVPGSTELPQCHCGDDMHIATLASIPEKGDALIRIYKCPSCRREMRLTVWAPDPAE